MGNIDWLKSLELPIQEEFDPEEGLWDGLFAGLRKVIQASGIGANMGGCLHISNTIARYTADENMFDIFPQYLAARKAFEKEMSFELGIHIDFSHSQYPLNPSFKQALFDAINNANKLNASAIVCHPVSNMAYDHEEIRNLFIDLLLDEDISAALRKSSVVLAWENMISGQFSSLKELVLFRDGLAERLIEKGYADLVDRHQLCLDTGHLILWRHSHYSLDLADLEITTYLPTFAKHLKVYHIHANDGTSDFHITPISVEFMEHKTRFGLNKEQFLQYSNLVLEWIQICEANKPEFNCHVHLETDKVPFSLDQTIQFASALKQKLKF